MLWTASLALSDFVNAGYRTLVQMAQTRESDIIDGTHEDIFPGFFLRAPVTRSFQSCTIFSSNLWVVLIVD